jgi:hypothetical protein
MEYAWQMVPTVLFIPHNASMPLSEAVKHAGSALFAFLQLDLSGQSGAAFQVGCPQLPRQCSFATHAHLQTYSLAREH